MTRSASRHWERACAYLRERQLPAARAEFEALRALAPGDWRCRVLSARIAGRDGRPREAAAQAVAAAGCTPDEPAALVEAIETLVETGESAFAHRLLGSPAWQRADAGDTLLRFVDLAHRFGEHAVAASALDRLIAARPGDGALLCHRGLQQEYLGRLDDAAADYEACLGLVPGYGRAAYQLARMPRQAGPDHVLELVRRGLACVAPRSRERADFEFARYHALERLGQDDAAWQALSVANAIMHARVASAAARQLDGLRQFRAWLATHTLPAVAASQPPPRPLFVLGMPRSGTTVLERMLGNHSQVMAAGELPDFGQQLLHVADTGSAYSDAFYARLPTLDAGELGRRYLAQTAWRARGAAWFIDKQPENWMLAGMIHAALPGAKILHLVRAPMDVCFSAWRARFVTYAWSYDFATLAAYHDEYRKLMDLWHARYPGAILDVPYAALVSEPAATLRTIMDFCGLAWEPGCEDLVRNADPVATLSAAAVREPLHARAIGEWRRYAARLEPLRDLLQSTHPDSRPGPGTG